MNSMKEPVKLPRVCNCSGCEKDTAKREKHLNHPFYQVVDEYTEKIARQQILKGAEKYPEPFNPDSWDGEELADHAMQELRDGQVYVTGMRDRMRKQETQIILLKIEQKELLQKMDKAKELVKALNEVSMSGGGVSLVSELETLLGVQADGNGGTGK